ncbi:MAG: hypothetical protein QOC97_1253, partial [Chloroflexota bacterium]|nr:hypothetical protein [Chloroflexota bacterium]
QGNEIPRTTYWCPTCQADPADPVGTAGTNDPARIIPSDV